MVDIDAYMRAHNQLSGIVSDTQEPVFRDTFKSVPESSLNLGLCGDYAGAGDATTGQFSCNNIGNSMSHIDVGGVSANVPVVVSLAVGLGLCDAIAGGGGAPAGQFPCNNYGNSLAKVDDSGGSAPTALIGSAFDAVECRAESEVSVPAEEQFGEEAIANRENTVLQTSQQPVEISIEYFELREFVNLHETEVNPLVQSIMQDPSVQIACKKLDNLLTEFIFDLAKDFLKANRRTLFELCEGLPSPSWHRCLVQISLTIARLAPPRRSIFSRCTFSILQANVNHLVTGFCSQLKDNFSRAEYEAFFCLPI